MPIRFAAPPSRMRNRMARFEVRRACGYPANDNRAGPSDIALHAALRHFSAHGLAAAMQASREAENARSAGDESAYAYWVDICRAFDQRMARELEARARTNCH